MDTWNVAKLTDIALKVTFVGVRAAIGAAFLFIIFGASLWLAIPVGLVLGAAYDHLVERSIERTREAQAARSKEVRAKLHKAWLDRVTGQAD